MKIKISFLVLSALILLTGILAGCSGSPEELKIQSVTYVDAGVYPFSYTVSVFTKDRVTYYDLTDYCMEPANKDFDYFLDGLPPEHEYSISENPLEELEWITITDSVVKNNFFNLQEEINEDGVMDVGWSYIEVITERDRHRTGGWAAGMGKGTAHKRYSDLSATLYQFMNQ